MSSMTSDPSAQYAPSPAERVRRQVEAYEASDGTRGNTMHGLPVVILTMRGARSGKIRKVPLMRVEHEGRYAAVASLGGAPKHPVWYHNLLADPHVDVQDGAEVHAMVAREVTGDERARWWGLAVAAFPNYAAYQAKTTRRIPLLVLEPVADDA